METLCVCQHVPTDVFAKQWLIHNVQNSLKSPYDDRKLFVSMVLIGIVESTLFLVMKILK